MKDMQALWTFSGIIWLCTILNVLRRCWSFGWGMFGPLLTFVADSTLEPLRFLVTPVWAFLFVIVLKGNFIRYI